MPSGSGKSPPLVLIVDSGRGRMGGELDPPGRARNKLAARVSFAFLFVLPGQLNSLSNKGEAMRRFAVVVAAFAVVVATALPATAAPASTEKVEDFYTLGLDADGDFKTVFCHKAHQVWKGDKVKENYSCYFEEYEDLWGPDTSAFLGAAVLPVKAMKWDPASTSLIVGNNLGVTDFRWYSDVVDVLDMFGPDCWMYSYDFRAVITPSGNMNAKVVYDPPVFEGACP